MIYLTGDTHIPIDISKLNMKNFPEQKNMTRKDYVIILGDFGLLWRKNREYLYWKKWLEEKQFTILWIDGNHENHGWLNSLPFRYWNGGKVHFIGENIIHLMRGQIFTLENKKFFVLGGAASYDKERRTFGYDWWPEEVPSWNEVNEGIDNLLKHENKVDYILTHTCPYDLITPMFNIVPDNSDVTTEKTLQTIYNTLDFKNWFFGHWHADKEYGKFRCFYQDIKRLI